MSIEEFPKEYQRLVRQVRRIDAEAAKYLENEAPKLKGFNFDYGLTSCFYFGYTPDGREYWMSIYDELEKQRAEYAGLVNRIAALGVDKETIDYLNNEAMDLDSFMLSNSLRHVFRWGDTPQKDDFWIDIADRLDASQDTEEVADSNETEEEPGKDPCTEYPDMEAVQKRFFKLLEFKREHCPSKVFEVDSENFSVRYSHSLEKWRSICYFVDENPSAIYFDEKSANLLVEKLNSGEFEL